MRLRSFRGIMERMRIAPSTKTKRKTKRNKNAKHLFDVRLLSRLFRLSDRSTSLLPVTYRSHYRIVQSSHLLEFSINTKLYFLAHFSQFSRRALCRFSRVSCANRPVRKKIYTTTKLRSFLREGRSKSRFLWWGEWLLMISSHISCFYMPLAFGASENISL